jgi:hypothetical protein
MKNQKTTPALRAALLGAALLANCLTLPAAPTSPLRPPSVPLVACDPYFSIWSPADRLSDADTVHWTGKPQRLASLVRIDNKPFRLMGAEPSSVPALPQTNLEVTPTRSVYSFAGEGITLRLTFMTPALPEDLMVYSRPVTYVTYEFSATDKQKHDVDLYFEASGEIAVNTRNQPVAWSKETAGNFTALKVGSVEQPVLARKGDDLRIDWGHLYLAAPESKELNPMWLDGATSKSSFAQNGTASLPPLTPGSTNAAQAAAALVGTIHQLGPKAQSRWLILAYDDEFSIQYFRKNLRPYWRRNGDDAVALLKKSASDYKSIKQRCEKFDANLMGALAKAGGDRYAKLCALAYRECCAANKVVADANGQPLMFPKENFSNGCIGTVDVIYPMAPQFLLFSPALTRAMLVPILDYAASPRWRWPFAPHDLGTYPLANGQVYGGGERTERDQMPVEETGNMLILLAALAQIEGNADFCAKYWPVLEKWTDYLKAKGFDPENQLCTDDFAGHLAHNVNLSAKAICGLGAFARLCEMRGEKTKAAEIMALAKEFAARWIKESDEGGHSRLAFDKPGTWSQKYNLVWDRILHLDLFPDDLLRKEMAFYKTKQNTYGLPLDVRKDYTKLDWTLWTATLTQNPEDFAALVEPVYRFLNETPNRVPLTDWYDTKTAKHVGFQARSVVGGVFLQVLYNQSEWKRWARQDRTKTGNWAALPKPPRVIPIVPTSENEGLTWRYTTEKPAGEWFRPGFDDSAWKEAPAGFGSRGTPGAVVRTEWKSSDIWLRREITVPEGKWREPSLRVHHDEDVEIYIDGSLASRASGFTSDYDTVVIRPDARALLKPGKHMLAVHCKQTSGGQYIDVGVVDLELESN